MRQAKHRDDSPQSEAERQREADFRHGYGMGADSVQHEHRRRPFLTEDEAVAAWREASK